MFCFPLSLSFFTCYYKWKNKKHKIRADTELWSQKALTSQPSSLLNSSDLVYCMNSSMLTSLSPSLSSSFITCSLMRAISSYLSSMSSSGLLGSYTWSSCRDNRYLWILLLWCHYFGGILIIMNIILSCILIVKKLLLHMYFIRPFHWKKKCKLINAYVTISSEEVINSLLSCWKFWSIVENRYNCMH